MKHLSEFVVTAKYLNHVNFSGMNFTEEQIRGLLEILRACEYLLALHLSDNGINEEIDLFYDCLEEFQVNDKDLIEINRSKRTEHKLHPKEPRKYDKLDIDYKASLREYFDFASYI